MLQKVNSDSFISWFFSNDLEDRYELIEKPEYKKKRLEKEKSYLERKINAHSELIAEWKEKLKDIDLELKKI